MQNNIFNRTEALSLNFKPFSSFAIECAMGLDFWVFRSH
jgi:hypothetical protein